MNRPDPDFRAPPSNVQAERALLGAILLNNKALDHVVDFVKPEYFTDPAAERVYAACLKLIDAGSVANYVTLNSFMESDQILIAAGGPRYLINLANAVSVVGNAREYGKIILDMHIRRNLIEIGRGVVESAHNGNLEESAEQILEETEEQLFAIGSSTERANTLSTIESAADEAIDLAQIAHKRDGALSGVTTGLVDLDRQMGGLHPSDLLILAGRPSMGKTALATAIAFNAAKYFASTKDEESRGKQVVFFSLEMSSTQLANRILSHVANVDGHRIRTGRLSNAEFSNLVQAKAELIGLPFQIDDQPGATVGAIRARTRRLARKKGSKGIGLIVIDYLQLMASSSRDKAENRVQELGAMTRGLKALAKDLNVPVLCLSQLSRAVEQRDDKRPMLSDLRESGTIEQDSDVVMFVYREQYYLERAEPKQRAEESAEAFHARFNKHQERLNAVIGIADVIISKQRHGPIGTVTTHFDGPTTWFSDLAKDEPQTRYMQGMD